MDLSQQRLDDRELLTHAKADDMKSDRAGSAGERMACGVIAKPKDYKTASGR